MLELKVEDSMWVVEQPLEAPKCFQVPPSSIYRFIRAQGLLLAAALAIGWVEFNKLGWLKVGFC